MLCDIRNQLDFWCISNESVYYFVCISDGLLNNMSSLHKKESEALSDLLTEVIGARQAAKKEYEWKLKKFYTNRTNQMQHGIFDDVKMPDIKFETGTFKDKLKKNAVLVHKAQNNSDQYFFAQNTHQHLNDELKEIAESLQKVMDIEKAISE